jgi:hypothetical protein
VKFLVSEMGFGEIWVVGEIFVGEMHLNLGTLIIITVENSEAGGSLEKKMKGPVGRVPPRYMTNPSLMRSFIAILLFRYKVILKTK